MTTINPTNEQEENIHDSNQTAAMNDSNSGSNNHHADSMNNNNNNNRDTTTTTTAAIDRNVTPLHPTIVQDMIPYLIVCIAILHGIYLYFHNVYAHHSTMFFGVLRIPCTEDCMALQNEAIAINNNNNNNSTSTSSNHNEKCGRPDLFAFQAVSGIVFVVVSLFGLQAWYHHQTSLHRITKRYSLTTPASRLYGYQYESHIILMINLSYQIWDFIISIGVIPEYCTTVMLLHHLVAALVAYYGLYNYMFSYYSIFFLGLSEVSSIFLVSLDLHKYFIPPTSSIYISPSPSPSPSVLSNLFFVYSQHVAGPLFVTTFIYYRIVLWYSVSKRLWDDVHSVTTTPTGTNSTANTTQTSTDRSISKSTSFTTTSLAEQLRPNRTYVLYIWLYANLPMGVLQLYFLSIIIYEIYTKFT